MTTSFFLAHVENYLGAVRKTVKGQEVAGTGQQRLRDSTGQGRRCILLLLRGSQAAVPRDAVLCFSGLCKRPRRFSLPTLPQPSSVFQHNGLGCIEAVL